jgi:hypothetical protein
MGVWVIGRAFRRALSPVGFLCGWVASCSK